MAKNLSVAYGMKKRNDAKCMAKGGMVNEKLDPGYEPEHTESLVAEIMKKKKMAKGGMVSDDAIDTMNDSGPKEEAYSKSADDLLAWESDLDSGYADNNDKSNEEEEMARKKERLAAAMKEFRSRG
jgi:hypothetical protein